MGTKLLHLRIFRIDVRLIEIEHHQLRFAGQQAKAAQAFALWLREGQTAQRAFRLQRVLTALQEGIFTFQLRIFDFFQVLRETLETLLHHRKVGEEEFIVEGVKIPYRIDAAVRMGHGRILEGAHDVRQRVRIPHE